jgi:hypothetical protein
MRKSTTLMSSLAIAGLAIAGGSAFTGGGVTRTAPDAFVGGTVTQLITGATLSNIQYVYSDPAQRSITSVELTFGGVKDGEVPSIAIAGITPGSYTCVGFVSGVSLCSAVVEAYDMTSLAITLQDAVRP